MKSSPLMTRSQSIFFITEKTRVIKLLYTISWHINLEFLALQIPSIIEIQLLVFCLRKMTSFSGSAVATLRITLEKFTATVTPVM
jgi:hypothetical protein